MMIAILAITNKSYADADQILDYQVTVDPREDSTLDITYEIKWKVLDSETEGPLSWCQIATPNENFDEITPLSDTIEEISKIAKEKNIVFHTDAVQAVRKCANRC